MDDKFKYSYTAPTEEERKEINSIRRDYTSDVRQQTDLEKLRSLDKKVKNPPLLVALTIGIIGLLIFGVGMCMALEWDLLTGGIVVGVVGSVAMGFAYPIYKVVLKKQKEKYGKRILELSDKLLNEDRQR